MPDIVAESIVVPGTVSVAVPENVPGLDPVPGLVPVLVSMGASPARLPATFDPAFPKFCETPQPERRGISMAYTIL